MLRDLQKKNKGFTLVEVVVGTSIILVLGLIVAQVYTLIISQISYYREQTVITNLADHYMEVARNLPYSQIGTLSGNPHGSLADMPSPINTTVNGADYQIYYVVNYIDDAADGTILASTDAAPNDYKQVKLYIKKNTTNTTVSFLTAIVPQGVEGLAAGGALSIKVFNSVGQPVPGATINIQNNILNPTINLTRTTDANGNWLEVGLPTSANSYHITATKSGYSSDQTYPISGQNQNPTKPDSTVSNGQVTQISFSIDKVSNLTFNLQNQVCSPLASVGLNVTGSKLIGTAPDVLKFDHDYTSTGAGQVDLNNIEWDSYTPTLTGASYMIYGTSPTQQVTILPDTSETFSLILGPKTNHSLLVIVKDASTSNVIEGALVNLQKTNPSSSTDATTGGNTWSQQDWSGGSGQTNFTDISQYFSDDGNISNNGIPSGVRLASISNNYVSSGMLTSSTFDTGTNISAYTTLMWQPTSQDPATTLKFQIATNNDNTTWNYLGPDGTASTYYTVPGTTMSTANNNARYVRYRAYLSTTNPTKTPVLTSVNINYVSGCFTPGQAMFAGLSSGSDYQLTVSANGYQQQILNNINISGYNILEVLLGQ